MLEVAEIIQGSDWHWFGVRWDDLVAIRAALCGTFSHNSVINNGVLCPVSNCGTLHSATAWDLVR